MFQIILKSIQHCFLLLFFLPKLPIFTPKIAMSTLSKLFNQINQKLKPISVHPPQLHPQHLLLSLPQLFIHELHLTPTQTTNLTQIVNITRWTHRRQLERNLTQQQLNTHQILVLNTELQRTLTTLALYLPIRTVTQQQRYQSLLHLVVFALTHNARLSSPQPDVLILTHRAHEMQTSKAISRRIAIIQIVLPRLQQILEHLVKLLRPPRILG